MNKLQNLEFHRNCYLRYSDNSSAEAILVAPERITGKPRIFCSCSRGKVPKCDHSKELLEMYQVSIEQNSSFIHQEFETHVIYNLIRPLIEGKYNDIDRLNILSTDKEVSISSSSDTPSLTFHRKGDESARLLDRLSTIKNEFISRGYLLTRARDFVLSPTERELLEAGHKTNRQAQEHTLWYRFAYHLFKEYADNPPKVELSICKESGAISLFLFINDNLYATINLPKNLTSSYITFLTSQEKILKRKLNVETQERSLYFLINQNQHDITLSPALLKDDNKSVIPIEESLFQSHTAFIPDKNSIIPFDNDSIKLISQGFHKQQRITQTQFSSFIEKNIHLLSISSAQDLSEGVGLDLFATSKSTNLQRIHNRILLTEFHSSDIVPHSVNGTSYEVTINYYFNKKKVSLPEIILAKQSTFRYHLTTHFIIDTELPFIKNISSNLGEINHKGFLTIQKEILFKLHKQGNVNLTITDDSDLAKELDEFLNLSPHTPYQPVPWLKTVLRPYQEHGVNWLLFLYDNHLGGLLCDDMGLGKTHQTTALICALRTQRNSTNPHLIVAPKSVISHWENIFITFAPKLQFTVFHGNNRELPIDMTNTIIITSYGLLKNEENRLQKINFDLIIFDEIQNLKNASTQASKIALTLRAQSKIGLTGTPIENSVLDLKSLFDIALPGYLGSKRSFKEYYQKPIEQDNSHEVKKQLKNITAPFILRRLKSTVLDELPEKIEDMRICEMSSLQKNLYQSLLVTQGTILIDDLKDSSKEISFIHIFALLNHLKQICSHPALFKDDITQYENYDCAKWDLLCEILSECFESNLKVVIFTQYRGIIEIISHYLQKEKIDHVTFHGGTEKRKEIINKFNTDPQCKVFVGSLKAGGVGIDLIGGSVVIHYDRWWNAAREEQATDRVYRIGQKKSVHVFKLVTKNSIEERIASIIDRKKDISDSIIQEDDAALSKIFTREELINILETPLL